MCHFGFRIYRPNWIYREPIGSGFFRGGVWEDIYFEGLNFSLCVLVERASLEINVLTLPPRKTRSLIRRPTKVRSRKCEKPKRHSSNRERLTAARNKEKGIRRGVIDLIPSTRSEELLNALLPRPQAPPPRSSALGTSAWPITV